MTQTVDASRLQRLVRPPFDPFYDKDGITIYNADCRQVLPFLGKFDLLLTDPPYGLGDKWKVAGWKSGRCGKSRLWDASVADWDTLTSFALLHAAIETCDEAIVWGGNYYPLPEARCWLIWDKDANIDQAHAEMAWTTLDKPIRRMRLSPLGVFGNGGLNGEYKVHPTQKPLAVIRWAMNETDAATVLDPFMGSGTTLVAAKLEGRKAVGIEISEKYCEAAANRLSQGTLF